MVSKAGVVAVAGGAVVILADAYRRARSHRPWRGPLVQWSRGRWFIEVDPTNANRLRLHVGSEDGLHPWVALDLGNGNSDPVWSIQAPLPAVLRPVWRAIDTYL